VIQGVTTMNVSNQVQCKPFDMVPIGFVVLNWNAIRALRFSGTHGLDSIPYFLFRGKVG